MIESAKRKSSRRRMTQYGNSGGIKKKWKENAEEEKTN